jgi:hypothetical protein
MVMNSVAQQPILNIGTRISQPFFGNGILEAYHSGFIQLFGDSERVAIFD